MLQLQNSTDEEKQYKNIFIMDCYVKKIYNTKFYLPADCNYTKVTSQVN